MRILKEEIVDKLSNCFSRICSDRKLIMSISENVHNKRNYSSPVVYSIVLQQVPLYELSDEELFWIIDGVYEELKKVNELTLLNGLTIKKVFTSKEIQQYSASKFVKTEEDLYPIEFDMLKISDDQWLSTISSKKLFKLYQNQIISYNRNTQRPLKQQMKNGYKIYKIDKNKESIKSIKESLKKGLFIPNCLTFNINEDNPNNDFLISENKLILKQGQFDLIDGFHRYSAIIELLLENPNVEFTFGVWIMNFDENKACRYISQEDKRNKISQSYSRALDVLNNDGYSSRIIQLLNESDTYFKGKLTRYNNYNIDYDNIVITINEIFKCNSRVEAKKISTEIINQFQNLEDDNVEIDKISNNQLSFILIGISMLIEKEIEYEIFKLKIQEYLKNKNILKSTNVIKRYYNC